MKLNNYVPGQYLLLRQQNAYTTTQRVVKVEYYYEPDNILFCEDETAYEPENINVEISGQNIKNGKVEILMSVVPATKEDFDIGESVIVSEALKYVKGEGWFNHVATERTIDYIHDFFMTVLAPETEENKILIEDEDLEVNFYQIYKKI